ncbi:MAG TPA: hypothetical protein VF141_09415 [Chryseolinea sp.]
MLFLLSEVEYKVKAERKHYSPISFTKAKHHCLVDTDDQKSNCEREDENVDEFHVQAKIAIIWFFEGAAEIVNRVCDEPGISGTARHVLCADRIFKSGVRICVGAGLVCALRN